LTKGQIPFLAISLVTMLAMSIGPTAFATSYTIPLLGFAWSHTAITYSISAGKNVDPHAVEAAKDAIKAWNDKIDTGTKAAFTLEEAPAGTKGDIRISLKVGTGVVLGSAQTFTNSDGSVAYSRVTLSGKAFGDPLGHNAVQTIAIQEIGHSLGLGHSNDPSDPMYGQYNVVKLSPSACDLTAFNTVHAWYPDDTFHPPTVSSVTC
jgi:predicted Zn-dependent protease